MDRTLDALLFRRELGAGTPRAYASALGSSASLVKRLTLRYELEKWPKIVFSDVKDYQKAA